MVHDATVIALPPIVDAPRRTAHRWLLYAAVALLAVGAVRLLVVARQLETAPDYLAVLARNATLGWIGFGYQRVAEKNGREQAEYWIAEANRILADQPTSELARGAAWMLNEPTHVFGVLDWRPPLLAASEGFEPIEAAKKFEPRAGARCIEIAALATQLAPDDPAAWRTRASLLFLPGNGWVKFGSPRDPNWLAILDEAAEHDPNNALYDYLAAIGIWHCADGVYTLDGLLEAAPNCFAAGMERFERGREKPMLRGPNDRRAMREFVERSHVERNEIAELVQSRFQDVTMIAALGQIQSLENGWVRTTSNATTVDLLGKSLRFDEQRLTDQSLRYRQYRNIASYFSLFFSRRANGVKNLADIDEQFVAAQTRNYLIHAAQSEISATVSPPAGMHTNERLIVSVVVSRAMAIVFLLAVLAMLAWVVRRATSIDDMLRWRHVGLRHTSVWLVALTATAAFFVMSPRDYDSTALISSVLRLSLQCVPLLTIVVVGVLVLRCKWSSRGSAQVLVILPLIGALLVSVQPWLIGWSSKLQLFQSGRHREHTIYILAEYFSTNLDDFDSIVARWLLDRGAGLTVVLALGLLTTWYLWWSGRRSRGPLATNRRMRFAGLAHELMASCAVVVGLLFLLSIWLLPSVLYEHQTTCESEFAQLTPMETYLDDLERAIRTIENDPARMATIRASVQPLTTALPVMLSTTAELEGTTNADPTPAEETQE